MQIRIKTPELKRSILIPFPNSLLGAKWIWRMVMKSPGINQTGNLTGLSAETVREIIKAIRKYVRQNGHFNLAEVNSSEGEEVTIRF